MTVSTAVGRQCSRAASPFDAELATLMPALRAFALRLCRNGDAADDLVQDTALKAIAGSHTFMAGSSMKSWLFTIMRHAFYSTVRTPRTMVSLDDDDFPQDSVPADFPRQEAPLIKDDANRLLEALPPNQRAAVLLVAVAGLPVEDAARELGVEPGTVKSRVSRARARMAELAATQGALPARGAAPDHIGRIRGRAAAAEPTDPAVSKRPAIPVSLVASPETPARPAPPASPQIPAHLLGLGALPFRQRRVAVMAESRVA
jgi:RNA polymerase sigma-70 factor (ECF subfamily)